MELFCRYSIVANATWGGSFDDRGLKPTSKLSRRAAAKKFEEEFGDEMVQTIISDQQIFWLIFDPAKEEIVQWVNSIN